MVQYIIVGLKLLETYYMRKKIMLLCVQLYLFEYIFFMIYINELDVSFCRIKIFFNIFICNYKLEDCYINFLKFDYIFLK